MARSRLDFYKSALKTLGFASTVSMQIQKRFARRDEMRLRAPDIRYPVYARRGTSDLNVFCQIYIEREYKCVDVLNIGSGLILDLGANVGFATAYFLSKFPRATVISVEPDPDNFSCLSKNARPYGRRCILKNAAVWSRLERLTLAPSFNARGLEWGRQVEVNDDGQLDTVTVPELLKASGYGRISLLKVDIEGAEKEVFRDASWIELVDNLVIELHGKEEEEIFDAAIASHPFVKSRSGEFLFCQRV